MNIIIISFYRSVQWPSDSTANDAGSGAVWQTHSVSASGPPCCQEREMEKAHVFTGLRDGYYTDLFLPGACLK